MRVFTPLQGMPLSIFHDKYARKIEGRHETWAEVSLRVANGNSSLGLEPELGRLIELITAGVMPTSGRHLQHGDSDQRNKMLESFSNCSSAMFSFLKFWLLLKGSGVGRRYDSEICRVNWDNLPNCHFVLEAPGMDGSGGHPDYQDWITSRQEAEHLFGGESENVRWFKVGDSAEGWIKAVEIMETATWQEKHRNKIYIFDFSEVRPCGSPIRGQQNRPSSGPVPLIKALSKITRLRGLNLPPWLQALFVDHYLAACVVCGGVRRSSRMAVKYWKDEGILQFIALKRGGHLYTANMSIGVDREFWADLNKEGMNQAKLVFYAACASAYMDKTGEPAFVNLDMMVFGRRDNLDLITAETYINPKYQALLDLHRRTYDMIDSHLTVAKKMRYPWVPNPCGEVCLALYGAYCVIGDICLANVEELKEAEDAARLMARFLIRTNMMDGLYTAEVRRTNRIGVGLTGIHEFAWKHFGLTFHQLIAENERSRPFWDFIRRLRYLVTEEAKVYSRECGLEEPVSALTIKPSGTISKVMGCTEGAHLAALGYYMRWVQLPSGSSELLGFMEQGYPVKDVSHQYPGYHVVGFPTCLPIVGNMGDGFVSANDATIEEQYEWIRLLEKHWFGEGTNGQVSYTLKYDPAAMTLEGFMDLVRKNQPTVRATSVFPKVDMSAYSYMPEEPLTRDQYLRAKAGIKTAASHETYDDSDLVCAGGACPIEHNINGQ